MTVNEYICHVCPICGNKYYMSKTKNYPWVNTDFSKARELCNALRIVCESTSNWEGAVILGKIAEHLYHEHYKQVWK